MSVLDKIFAHKRIEVARASANLPINELIARAADVLPTRGFRRAIESQDGLALIAEVKKASPSQGLIRDPFEPDQIALAYERAGATCLSVLTDVDYFQGSPENLRITRGVTQLPALRKDFIYDPYQVWEAKVWGADAILLIMASLADDQVGQLSELANSLDLDVLAEVHDEVEAERTLNLGLPLVGINNRDLRTFKTDLSVTERISPLLRGQATIVSESALETRADVRFVESCGAKAVLIGTTFCRAPIIEDKVRELMVDAE
jgi:indole-3-glycerol phosphate synthase